MEYIREHEVVVGRIEVVVVDQKAVYIVTVHH